MELLTHGVRHSHLFQHGISHPPPRVNTEIVVLRSQPKPRDIALMPSHVWMIIKRLPTMEPMARQLKIEDIRRRTRASSA